MEQNLIYYVDQYLDGQFVSRSEPYFDRESCENVFLNLNEGSGVNISFKMNVSMPLKDYEDLVLSTERIRIRYIDRETSRPNSPVPSLEDEFGSEPQYNYLLGEYTCYEPSLDYAEEYDLEPECESVSMISTPTRKAYKNKSGYLIYNNKKNREFLLNVGWDDIFEPTNSKKLLFIKRRKINDYDINFFDYFREVKMSKNVRELYYA